MGYDPLDAAEPNSLDKHGNPNVLTLDKGTSKLAQSPSAQTALVQVGRYEGEAPPITAFEPVEYGEPIHQGRVASGLADGTNGRAFVPISVAQLRPSALGLVGSS